MGVILNTIIVSLSTIEGTSWRNIGGSLIPSYIVLEDRRKSNTVIYSCGGSEEVTELS